MDITRVIGLLTTLVPVAQTLVPLIQKAARGEQFNDSEIAQLRSVADALDAQIEARIASTKS